MRTEQIREKGRTVTGRRWRGAKYVKRQTNKAIRRRQDLDGGKYRPTRLTTAGWVN